MFFNDSPTEIVSYRIISRRFFSNEIAKTHKNNNLIESSFIRFYTNNLYFAQKFLGTKKLL